MVSFLTVRNSIVPFIKGSKTTSETSLQPAGYRGGVLIGKLCCFVAKYTSASLQRSQEVEFVNNQWFIGLAKTVIEKDFFLMTRFLIKIIAETLSQCLVLF